MPPVTASMPPLTLRPAAATAIGSFPGTDPWETCQVVAGELGDFPMLAELPARGPGADMIGRTLGLLSMISPEFSGQTTTTGWAMTRQSSSDLPAGMRRAQAWLGEDLDAAQSQWGSHAGAFKIALAGPFTLSAAVELINGELIISDDGASNDLADALNEVVRIHVAAVARRLPGAAIVVQLDEPTLPAVLAGSLRTQSGWGGHHPVAHSDAQRTLAELFATISAAGATPAIHCCGKRPPLEIFRAAGAQLVSVDLTLQNTVSGEADDQFGELFDAGRTLMAGLARPLPDLRQPPSTTSTVVAPLLGVLDRLSIGYGDIASQIVVTPTCGLAGVGSLANARRVLEQLAGVSRALRDEGSLGESH